MLAPVALLKKYVDIKELTVSEISDLLTNAGVEVGAVYNPGEKLFNIIAGKIIKLSKEDNLNVCEVDCGIKTVKLVTTAKNVNINNVIPVALPGSVIANGLEVDAKNIKGYTSEGMMLSVMELGLYENADGIWLLDSDIKQGTDLIKELNLNDYILEVEITANRPDCLSIIGLARELAAISGKKLKVPEFELDENPDIITKDYIKVIIENYQACPRYTARIIKDVEIKPSPSYMQTILFQSGMRPINNIVDITNFVLLETGQPLHAFDYDKIRDKTIIVRNANEKEMLKTIDSEEHKLTDEYLVIADSKNPVALAGVMGGFDSEVSIGTKDVLLESAYFDPVSIRKSSKLSGLSTEASYRFERGADYHNTIFVSDRCSYFFGKYCSGKIGQGILDENNPIEDTDIDFRFNSIKRHLGIEIPAEKIVDILEKLGFKVQNKNEQFAVVKVPGFRLNDVYREIDLVEEVARIYGLNNIESKNSKHKCTIGMIEPKQKFRYEILQKFVDLGFNEVINYSFTEPKLNADFSYSYNEQEVVKLKNQLRLEMSVMRNSLLPGLINTLKYNVSHGIENVNIIETGIVFRNNLNNTNVELPVETNNISGLMMTPISILTNNKIDYFYIKGLLDSVLSNLNLGKLEYLNTNENFLHPGYSAELKIADEFIGYIGKINPKLIADYDLPNDIYTFELILDRLFDEIKGYNKFVELPKYPAIKRDLAVVLDKDIPYLKVEDSINELNIKELESFEVVSVYAGNQIPADKISLALSFKFRKFASTLTDQDAEGYQKQILDKLNTDLNVTLR